MTEFKAPPLPPKSYTNEAVEEPTAMAPEDVSVEAADPVASAPVPEPEVSPVTEPVSEPVSEPAQPMTEIPETPAASSGLQANINKIQAKTTELQQRFNALPNSKKNLLVGSAVFLFGLLLGGWLFGGVEEVAPVAQGLQGVISNPDIKEPLKRCGQVSSTSPCVFYVMNGRDRDKRARDFFDSVAAATQRKASAIEMENVRYAVMPIPAGYFAQIKIPAYK